MAADHSEARVAGYLSSVGVTRRSSRHYIGQHTSSFALQNDVAIFRRCSYATITDSTGTMWVFIAPGGGSQGQAAAGAARLVLGEPPTQSPSPGTPRSASSPATLPNTATPPPQSVYIKSGLPLGQWLSAQRRAYRRGTMAAQYPDRITRLRACLDGCGIGLMRCGRTALRS